jgi:hypothetical protein
MSNTLNVNIQEFERLQRAIQSFPGNAEDTINAVLHNEGGQLIQEAIQPLIPMSGKRWKGKKAPARTGNSLRSTNENLAVWVRSTKSYQYLYFPDDGTNTRRHAGNQQFFYQGAESVRGEVVDRCVGRLIQTFEKGD